MLNIYVYESPRTSIDVVPAGLDLIRDVEKNFYRVEFEASETNKVIVKTIEEGVLIDRYYFLDRFGCKMTTDNLSTGCKAALMVDNSNFVIDLLECGNDIKSYIFANCSGSIAIRWSWSWLPLRVNSMNRLYTINGSKPVSESEARRRLQHVF